MLRKLLRFHALVTCLALCGLMTQSVNAQITVTINAMGGPGSYVTGSVNSSGTKNDDLMTTINATANRGWAVFDLSSIPSGAIINSASITFTTTANTVSSGATNYIGGYQFTPANDPATVAGSSLYTLLYADGTTNYSASTWTANAANTLSLNSAGLSAIANALGGSFVASFVRGSTNTYEIYGYGGTPTQQPKIQITYVVPTACSTTPVLGNTVSTADSVCSGSGFTLSLQNTFVGITGINFQWQSSSNGTTWTNIAGQTNSTYSSTITASTYYRAYAVCNTNSLSDTSSVKQITIKQFYNCYCSASATCDEAINAFSINTISNNTGCSGGYANYTSMSTSLVQGQTYPISITTSLYYNSDMAYVWFDYNHDGVFTDTAERVTLTYSGSGGVFNGSVTIPFTALAGPTGMRGRMMYNTYSGPCGVASYGETEDYIANIVAATACSGTPTPGNTLATVTAACSGSNFTLSLQNPPINTGMTIAWQSSSNGTTWTTIANATNNTFTTSQTAATYYRAQVTCTNSTSTATSTAINIPMNTYINCYCAATSQYGTSGGYYGVISNVHLDTLNSNSSYPSSGPYYTNYPAASGTTTTLSTGLSYTLSVTSGYYNFARAWIDWDHSGTFDAGESYDFGSNSTGNTWTGTNTIVVPTTAAVGQTKMRVRTEAYFYSLGATDPCTTTYYGETEDYTISVVVPPACSGTPTPGNTLSTVTSACSGSSFTLSLQNPPLTAGITYVWQSSPNGTTWTNITGATNSTLTTSQTVATYYRAQVICSGTSTGLSSSLQIPMNTFINCYCSANSQYGTSGGFYGVISNVHLDSINNTSTYPSASPYATTYAPATGTTTTVYTGLAYQLSVTSGYYNFARAWIDWDHSGTFDATESYDFGYNSSGNTWTGNSNVLVPTTALTGQTKMRVRTEAYYYTFGATDACTTTYYGETEDYTLSVAVPPACTGTPAPGSTVSTADSVCSTNTFALSLSNPPVTSGITYAWQSSPNGTTWTNITGATNSIYSGVTQSATTYYRAAVTCSGSTGYSATKVVIQKQFYNCYCTSMASNTGDEEILNVTVGSLNNTSTCATTGGSPNSILNRYSDYTGTVTAPSLSQSVTYSFSVQVGTCNGNFFSGAGIFIDFNHNGDFTDAGENVFTTPATTSGPFIASGSFQIPATALLGTTRMRVVNAEGYAGSSLTPCLMYGYGETEDYLINVTPAPACTPPSGLTASAITSTSANLSWTAVAGAAGYEYVVSTTNTTPTSGTATTATSYAATGLSATAPATYYLFVRTNCGSTYSSWSSLTFQTTISNDNAPGAVQITVGATCSGLAPFTNVGATQSAGEPAPNCLGSGGSNSAWYKFTAPASGSVKISNDFNLGTQGGDTRMAVFSATDSSNYSTYTMISCDDDNGVVIGSRSIIYAAGLTPGARYYVEIDGYSSSTTTGTFCMEISEINSSMVVTSGSCTSIGSVSSNTGYTGYRSIVDASTGNIVANVKADGNGSSYSISLTKNTGALRSAGSIYYLDRNWLITGPTTGNHNVQVFFTAAELAVLQGSVPGANLSTLNVTRQTGNTCNGNFIATGGSNSLLTQTGSGGSNGLQWLQYTTPGFSNFYIVSGTTPLAIELKDISATNTGAKNRIDWSTANELSTDNFVLERSADGRNFTDLATVSTHGKASSYTYYDEKPVSGINYYRLRMLDINQKATYSKIVNATVKGNGSFTIEAFPNPVENILNVAVYGKTGTNATIQILDVTGKLISQTTVVNNQISIDMKGLSAGVYLIKYTDDTNIQTIRVNKQ